MSVQEKASAPKKKQNKTKQKQKRKQNKTKQNKTKQKTKQNKTKQNKKQKTKNKKQKKQINTILETQFPIISFLRPSLISKSKLARHLCLSHVWATEFNYRQF